ncbi:MAG: MBOAT family protein [Bacteroidetes bacterium]|nr:MBOAT family protein [Bacteroidota bacterium]
MLFNSLIFTVFLPIVFILYWITPPKYRNYFLLLASYYFYYSYNPWFLLLLIGTSAADYLLAKQISATEKQKRKKIFLALSLAGNLGVLFIYKYFVFFYNSSVEILDLKSSILNQFIIPAGLSFYTFQSLSYTIDVYRGKYRADDKFSDFLLFVSFFPHMVAGPIVRYNDLMPQFKIITYFKNINWQQFATLVIWGYFKKLVIADNLNLIVTPVFNNVTAFSGFELLLAGFLFVIQVYCDFSGYSDIATGVAKLFNINLTLNWRRPLFSRSLHEFWQRNHISITTWFRDYLYIGMGGNRVTYNRWLLNIFLVFVISSFWHGANITFIIWGTLHGLFYIAEVLLRKKFPAVKVPAFLGHLYLLGFHTATLIAFRANSFLDLRSIYKSIFSFGSWNFSLQALLSYQDRLYFVIMAFSIFILFMKEVNEEYAIINKHKTTYAFLKPTVYIFFVILIFILGNFSANTFIYFQF